MVHDRRRSLDWHFFVAIDADTAYLFRVDVNDPHQVKLLFPIFIFLGRQVGLKVIPALHGLTPFKSPETEEE